QADNLSNKVKTFNPVYNIDKVYIDAFKGLSTPGGKRYPDMVAAFNNRINKGCLIMNYTGHGGEVGLSAERVVDIPGINSWTNFNNLPLFITATCEFSRYDDPDRVSAGEICLLNPRGGSIAMLTTCRLAFSNFNETLNNKLFDYVFKKQPDNKMPTLGDIIKNTKANLGQNFFYSNFHLLGDPALTLAYPKNKVITSEINGNMVTPISTDTIKGLSKVTVKGFVADTSGVKLSGFNGYVYPMVFDKKELITCQLNDPGSSISSGTLVPFKFVAQQNIIYKGKAEVKNGDFSFTFIVPKDVSFSYGNAKISYYATDGTTDANGNHDSVKVGGLDPNAVPDVAGPTVKLYLNSKSFVNGGTTNENPILMAEVSDSSGINTVGTGFGHDITAIVDNNTNLPYVLNDYYETNLNSYQSGVIRYQLKDLEEGNHQLSLKVWDVQNNSSVTSADFVVAKSADLALNMVLNYPNPFTTNTKFFFEHNRNCDDIKVLIQVFTI
ncbi:MAG: type IX secretion system sortase PorU, partial [Bacteroidia bacterium]|nr:type IX secretion system sortase PorU [Bacteroidia bacterium]